MAGTHLVTFPWWKFPACRTLGASRSLRLKPRLAWSGPVRQPGRCAHGASVGLHVIPFLADRFIGHAKTLAAGTSLASNVVPRRRPG